MVTDDRSWITQQLEAERSPGPAIIGTRASQPDTAAKANVLARRLGLPPVTVERNLPELQQNDQAQRTVNTVRTGSQYLQNWYRDPRNAAAAGDDAAALKSISDHFQAFWRKPQSNAPSSSNWFGLKTLWSNLTDPAFRARYEADQDRMLTMGVAAQAADQTRKAQSADGFWDRAFAMGRSGLSQLEAGLYQLGGALQEWDANNPLPWTSKENTAAARRKAEELRARAAFLNGVAPVRGATTWADVKAKPTPGRIAAFGVETGIQSIPGMAAAAFALPGYVASQAGNIGQQRAQNNGRNDASITDVAAATPAALASALLERLGIESIFGKVAGKVATRVGGGAVAQTATRVGFAAAGEATTEAAQSAVEYAGGAVGTNKGGNLSDALDQMAQGALAGFFMGGTIRGVHEASGRIRSEVRTYAEANRARAGAVIMDSLMSDAESSRLRERDPEAFRQFVEGQTQGTPVENVYIPAEAIRDLMQDGYRDDPFWSDYADQIDEALALDGDVVIPTADVATRLAGTDGWRTLQPEARFSPGGMSEAELASLEQSHAADLDRMQSQVAEQIAAAAAAAEPAAQVYSQVRDGLANAGFAPDAADRYAQLWAANRETWGARLGTDALAYHEANPVAFRRILPETLSRVQAADGIDVVINAMRKGKEPATDRQRFGPSLMEFLAGNIDDVGGDLASMGADRWHRDAPFRRRFIRRSAAEVAADRAQGGMLDVSRSGGGLDEALQAAIEAGYFPELRRNHDIVGGVDSATYDDLPDTNVLLDAIDEELRGNPRYSEDNRAERSTTDDIRVAAEELRRMLDARGLDPDKASPADIKRALELQQSEAEANADTRGLEQFAGLEALGAPVEDLGRAISMEREGASKADIEEKTGWRRGPDGQWRWEIDDSKARFTERGSTMNVGHIAFLGDMIEHADLFEAYPQLRDVPVRIVEGAGGGWNGQSMTLGVKNLHRFEAREGMGVLLHEIQHAIQTIEGFAFGASPKPEALRRMGYGSELDAEIAKLRAGMKQLDDSGWGSAGGLEDADIEPVAARNIYQRSAGEIEARNTQARRNMTLAERREDSALWTQDRDDGRAIVRFEPGAVERELRQGARGRALLGDNPGAIIDLFQGSDLSTVIHETGHVWLEEFKRNAANENAPDDVKADWETVKAWFAENGAPIGEDGFIPTEAHELWARGWERYAMEGKAPSSALRRAFDAFRGWLLQIYKHVSNLRVDLKPEVREVFDRMLATEDAINEERARQGVKAMFTDAAQAGMTDAEFAAYQQATTDARSEAFDALLYKTMATIRRARTKAWKEEEATVRASMTDAINSRPEFRALHLLRTGRWLGEPDREAMKVKLDRAWLVDQYGADALALLPKGVPPIYGEGGADADTVAAMVGFRNGDEMVRSLMGVEQVQAELRASGDKRTVRNRLIDEQTAATMTERHGDPLNDGSIEEEALAAINNDRQGEVIAAEARQLGKRGGRVPTPYALAREWAARKIAEGKVVDVASRSAIQRYARATAKAARSAEAALIAGDIDEAFRQKQAQMLNQALLVEAKRAADDVDTAVDRLSKIAKRATMKSVDQEYLDRAHGLLEKFDFRARSQRSLDEQESFGVWAAQQQANGIDVVIPPRLEDAGVHYSRMSVEELKGLDDSVRQIIHLGRLKQKLLDAQEQRDFDEVVGEALGTVEGLRQRDPNNRMSPNIADKLKANVASADAALLKMETVFDWLDDGNANGTFNRVVFRRIADAQVRERDMMGDYVARIQGLLSALPKETIKRWSEHVTIPEFVNRETGQSWDMTRDQLIAVALNVGNEGNLDKLARGYGWSPEAVMRVLNRELRPEEWRFVQSMWDTIETLWPEISGLEKRLNGVEPEKVAARSFTLDDGTAMTGGYYPVVYDTSKSLTAEAQAAAAGDALFENIYTRATTPRGFTKARTDVARPMLLSLSVINRHVAEVIHDVTHREAVIDADRFLSDRRIVKAVRDTLGPEVQRQFRPWLQHIANEWAIDRRGVEGWDKLAKTLRTHSTMIGMGYRLTTILAQLGGYANSTEQIGSRWMASGFRAATGTPAKIAQSFDFVMEKSGEVRHRMDTLERDINANVRDLQGKRGTLANVRRFAFHGIGYMDRVVVIPTWLGAYNKALHEGMADADAVYYADKIVRNSQGAGAAKDLASIQRGSEWMKLATMFYSYANTFYNRQRSIARDAGDAIAARRSGDFPALLARSFWLFAVSPMVPMLVGATLGGGGPKDDEDWGMWAFQNMLAGLFMGVPVVREVASSAASGFDYAFTPASRMIETAIKSAKDLKRLADMDEETEPSKHAVKNAVETTGYVTRLPVGQISNAAQFISDWANGDADPKTVGDWLKGLQTGKIDDERDR